jgi:hypothetical protein
MKPIKLSLVFLIVLGSTVFASESLSDAFKNGKVSGEFRFVYTKGSDTDVLETKPVDNANVGSIATTINYVTDDFYGWKLGLGFEAAHDLNFHNDNSAEDDARNSVSTTLLQNFYLQYSFLKSNIKIGRQTIKTPLIMTSRAFALEDSFDAAVLTLNEIPSTMLQFIYIQEWNMRYKGDASTSPTQQDEHFSDGMYSLYFKNTSIKNLIFDGQYLTTDEDKKLWDAPVFVNAGGYDEYYMQATYKFKTAPLSLGIKYAGAKYDNPTILGKDTATLYGIKAATAIKKVKLNFAYTTVDEEANFPGTFGHIPDTVAYTDMLTNNAIFAGVDAFFLEARYDFGIPHLGTKLKFAHYTQSDEGIINSGMNLDNANEVNVDIKYAFSGLFKGLSTRLRTGYGTYDQDVPTDDFTYARFYLKYNF